MKKRSLAIISFVLSFALLISSSIITGTAASSSIVNNGIYYIKNQRTGKYLTAVSATSGANIYQANYTGSTLQRFKLVQAENSTGGKYYNIISAANTSLRLDVANASNSDGANIGLFVENSAYSQAQRFKLTMTNSSTVKSYRIMPKLSSTRVLSVTSGSLLSGANVQLATSSSSYAYQDWIFERVADLEIQNVTPINIYKQEHYTTCGSACVKMILKKYGITVDEDDIKERAQLYKPSKSDGYTYIEALTPTINYYLAENNSSVRYAYVNYGELGIDIFTLLVALATENNIPIQLPIDNTTGANTGLPYTTSGHYLVICGAKADTTGDNIYVCVADPYMNSAGVTKAGVWEIPIEELYNFNKNHSGWVITIAD